MVTAIQSGAAPAAPVVSRGSGSTAIESATPPVAQVQQPVIAAPKKVEIPVDPEKQRANLEEAINRINELMHDGGRGLNFSIDEAVGGPVVQVRNLLSGEVIRQIPNEVVVKVAHSIEDLKGMLHNEAA